MSEMSISVALATFNGAQYLSEQLQSIAYQTILPNEVIICDDGSNDNTIEVAESFAKEVSFRVKIVQNSVNLGYAQNFNKALNLCTKKIVFLCDQDDYWLPNKIERVLLSFVKYPKAVLAIHDLDFCKEDLSPVGQTKIERMLLGQNIEKSYVVGMATAIKKDFLRLCLPIPNISGVTHDRWLHNCALAVDGKIIINEVLAMYRRHGENVTANTAVNLSLVLNKWTYLWARFKEPSRVKFLENVHQSPLASWLSEHRQVLLESGYLDESRLQLLIDQECLLNNVLNERNRLLQLARWRRVPAVFKLLYDGSYKSFFSWKSALKDLVKP